MRLIEKILTIIVIITITSQLVFDYKLKSILLLSTCSILGLYYIVASLELFHKKENTNKVISVLSGFFLFTSLVNMSFLLRGWREIINQITVLPILALFAFLIINHIFKIVKFNVNKNLFIRLGIVTITTFLLAFTSPENSTFRNALLSLNKENHTIKTNLLMYEFTQKSKEAYKNKNCQHALDYSLKALEHGQEWIKNKAEIEIWRITEAHRMLFLSYRCFGDEYYNNNQFETSKDYYLKAETVLSGILKNIDNIDEMKSQTPIILSEIAQNNNELGLCYKKLNIKDSARIRFKSAIEIASQIEGFDEQNLKIFNNNINDLMKNENQRK